MSTLAIFLFGETRLKHADVQAQQPVTKGLQELLAFLLLRRERKHKREVLADLFWCDRDPHHARCCLNTALWRLRRLLEPSGVPRGTYLKVTGMDEIAFNCESDYWLDVAAFENCVDPLLDRAVTDLRDTDIARLEEAVALCKGDVLDGVYSDWALHERDRLRRLHLNALYALMSSCRYRGKYDSGLRYGYQILLDDPLREEVHRAVMELHLAAGNRAAAVNQFEIYKRLLAEELGVPPMEETQALYNAIVDSQSGGSLPHPAPVDAAQERPRLYCSLRQHLSLAKQNGTSARDHHRQAERLVAELEALEGKGGKRF